MPEDGAGARTRTNGKEETLDDGEKIHKPLKRQTDQKVNVSYYWKD